MFEFRFLSSVEKQLTKLEAKERKKKSRSTKRFRQRFILPKRNRSTQDKFSRQGSLRRSGRAGSNLHFTRAGSIRSSRRLNRDDGLRASKRKLTDLAKTGDCSVIVHQPITKRKTAKKDNDVVRIDVTVKIDVKNDTGSNDTNGLAKTDKPAAVKNDEKIEDTTKNGENILPHSESKDTDSDWVSDNESESAELPSITLDEIKERRLSKREKRMTQVKDKYNIKPTDTPSATEKPAITATKSANPNKPRPKTTVETKHSAPASKSRKSLPAPKHEITSERRKTKMTQLEKLREALDQRTEQISQAEQKTDALQNKSKGFAETVTALAKKTEKKSKKNK